MNEWECSHESAVQRAIDSDGWTGTLRLHVAQCPSCGEVAQVTRFMKRTERVMERNTVPDARVVWTRIQLAERLRLAERARRPSELAWMFAKCWFACGSGLFVYRGWPAIGSFLVTMPLYIYVAFATGLTIVFLARQSLKG
jgi:hypothetical protein